MTSSPTMLWRSLSCLQRFSQCWHKAHSPVLLIGELPLSTNEAAIHFQYLSSSEYNTATPLYLFKALAKTIIFLLIIFLSSMSLLKAIWSWAGMVAHTCDPSYVGSGDWDDTVLRPAWAKVRDLISTNKLSMDYGPSPSYI
jgi:hypothetical protein